MRTLLPREIPVAVKTRGGGDTHMRKYEIMVIGRHHLDLRAETRPERFECGDAVLWRALHRRQDAPAVLEQFGEARARSRLFSARDGVPRNEMGMGRNVGTHVTHDGALHRTHVGDDGAGLDCIPDGSRERSACSNRRTEDDEVRPLHRIGG